MARYIDAEKIKYHELSVCGGHGLNCEYTVAHKHEVDAIPTEDVVPRAELENLQDELDLYGFVYGVTPDKQKVIGKVRSDVAREIFEEIKTCLEYEYMSYLKAYDYTLLTRIEELEKKYTEK